MQNFSLKRYLGELDSQTLHSAAPLRFFKRRALFCGEASRTSSRVYRRLSKQEPYLFIPAEKRALEFGAIPGPLTFYTERFPSYFLKAIASASRVVTFLPEVAYVAVSKGIPAVVIGSGGGGVPSVNRELSAKEIVASLEEIFSSYPWPRIEAHLQDIGMEITTRSAPIPKGESHLPPLHLASISDSGYLPFLVGFIENALGFSDDIRFHVLALDAGVRPALEKHFPGVSIDCRELHDIWAPDQLDTVLSRTVGFRAFTSKPQFLLKVLRDVQAPIVYCDSDVFFFESPRLLESALKDRGAIVFPHRNDEYAPQDGRYNAGMIVVGPKGENFLEWWAGRCLQRCNYSTAGDQGHLSEATFYYSEIGIYEAGDQDVARWNLKSNGIHFDSERPEMALTGEKIPVKTYHAAFIDSIGLFECKWSWDGLVHFYSGLLKDQTSDAFLKTVFQQQRLYWLSLSRALKLEEIYFRRWFRPGLLAPFLNLLTRSWGRTFISFITTLSRLFKRPTNTLPEAA